MYTPQIYSGTNVHANMPYCETRMKGLPTSIGVMCIHLPTTPFIYRPIHLPLAWRARLLGEGPCTLDKLRVGWRSRNFIFEAPISGQPLRALRGPHWSGPTPFGLEVQSGGDKIGCVKTESEVEDRATNNAISFGSISSPYESW